MPAKQQCFSQCCAEVMALSPAGTNSYSDERRDCPLGSCQLSLELVTVVAEVGQDSYR